MRLTETEIIQSLKKGKDLYSPLIINQINEQVSFPEGYRVGAIVEFSMKNGPSFVTVVEITSIATPENILKRARQFSDFFSKVTKPDMIPLLIAPYIGNKQSQILADKDISWIDLCGNMRVSVPGKIYIEKTGNKNKFPDTSPIKKIFEGISSLVSRSLLLQPEGFESQYKLVDFINNRNANITTGTVSRVLKSLEEELLVRRNKNLICVTEREKLLNELCSGYIKSSERRKQKIYKFAIDNTRNLFAYLSSRNIEYLACGFYAAKIKGLASTDEITIYVKSIDEIKRKCRNDNIDLLSDWEFGNISIIETSEPAIWFNTKQEWMESAIDDIQLYLEMMSDTPRGPKVAEKLRELILIKN